MRHCSDSGVKDLHFYAARDKGPTDPGWAAAEPTRWFLIWEERTRSQHTITGQRKGMLGYEAGRPVHYSVPKLDVFHVAGLTDKIATRCPRQPGEAARLQTVVLGPANLSFVPCAWWVVTSRGHGPDTVDGPSAALVFWAGLVIVNWNTGPPNNTDLPRVR